MLPFGSNDIFREFLAYNNSVWPMPMIGYVLGLIAIISMCYENSLTDRMVSLILGFFWMWIGVVQILTFFRQIMPYAEIIGLLFVLQSVLFLYFGVIRNRIKFRITMSGVNIVGFLFVIYAIIVYPLLGFFYGNSYPEAAVFGIAANPTTVFTCGMILFTVDNFPILLLIIPFLWSLLAFGMSMLTGIHEDFPLFVAGVSSFWLTLLRLRKQKNQMIHHKKDILDLD